MACNTNALGKNSPDGLVVWDWVFDREREQRCQQPPSRHPTRDNKTAHGRFQSSESAPKSRCSSPPSRWHRTGNCKKRSHRSSRRGQCPWCSMSSCPPSTERGTPSTRPSRDWEHVRNKRHERMPSPSTTPRRRKENLCRLRNL